MKWLRQYEGPFLVIEKPSRLTAKIQRTAKAKPKVVRNETHLDNSPDVVVLFEYRSRQQPLRKKRSDRYVIVFFFW